MRNPSRISCSFHQKCWLSHVYKNKVSNADTSDRSHGSSCLFLSESSLSTRPKKLPGRAESSSSSILVPRNWDAVSCPQGIIICGHFMIKENCKNLVQLFGVFGFSLPFFPEQERWMIALVTRSTGPPSEIGFNSKGKYEASHCSGDCAYGAG